LFIFTPNARLKKTSRLFLRIVKKSGISIAAILILLFFAPYLFPDTVSREIKKWTNQSIKGELNFAEARLSFFTHFPSLTLTLYGVDLKGSAPFAKDTLLSTEEMGFGVNLQKLIFDHQVTVNKIYLNKAFIHVLVNEEGQANYNIYKSDFTAKKTTGSDTSASLHLEKIVISDSRLVYNDLSIPMQIQADHMFYEGTGDLSKSVFDLTSHIQTDSVTFTFDNKAYVKRKAIDASLVTRINTQTLALIFQKNLVKMNKLNLVFNGTLNFLKNGYEMDFKLSSQKADLYQLVTILPPEYLDWLRETTVKGNVNLESTLKGKYIASTGEMPDYQVKLHIQDGYISFKEAKLPLSQLNGDANLVIPALDPEQLQVQLDSIAFHIDKDFFRAHFKMTGLSEPEIEGAAEAEMDLQNLKKATGISQLDMAGQIKLHLNTKGKYAKKVIKISLRNKDTVIASIPAFDVLCSLQNGYIKYYKVAQPVNNIFLNMHASCADSDYRHAYFQIDSLHAAALNNFIEGKGIVHASRDFPFDMRLKGSINLAEIRQIYPLDSLTISGLLHFDLNSAGKYAPDHHLFPKTDAHFSLKNGNIQTKYYPHPIEKINIEVAAQDAQSDLTSLNISIHPASLVFEGKPFQFDGTFKNFYDLNYNLSVNGEIDLGKIYQVFARKDIGVTGFIRAHAAFKGKQSDAKNQHYDLLHNSGTLVVNNLTLTQELFPKPFLIRQGVFRFADDKMWFDSFRAVYGNSNLQLDGFAENVINYILGMHEILKGNFNLKSKNIDLNEFAVYASSAPATPAGTSASGVIMIPANLDLAFKADAEKVLYNDVVLSHFTGGLNINPAGIQVTETNFEMIGCQVTMDGKYAPISMLRASFNYHLVAKDFDVQRAYKEIKLFHDLASSAAHASGIISLDYTLSGKLNEKMYPIYPSLVGSGVLSVKKVKFNGWKLFNAVSSQSQKTELKDPDLSKIDLKSSIKNNLITIQKLKFKTGGMRIRFEGQTSFDNRVNFKMRIGLPPLGIIGIPIRVTGTSDIPKIKMSSSENDPLQEKEDLP